MCDELFHADDEPGWLGHSAALPQGTAFSADQPETSVALKEPPARTTRTKRRRASSPAPYRDQITPTPTSKHGTLRWLGATACLLLAGLFFFKAAPDHSSLPTVPSSTALVIDDSPQEYVTSNIEDLRVGDYVLALDPETGETVEREVVDVFERTTYQLRVLQIRGPNGATQGLRKDLLRTVNSAMADS